MLVWENFTFLAYTNSWRFPQVNDNESKQTIPWFEHDSFSYFWEQIHPFYYKSDTDNESSFHDLQ